MAPESARLVGPIHFGSETAVVEAPPNARFTHVLCVAEELSRPMGLGDKVVFEHVPIQNGVENVIRDEQLSNAVEWLREVWEQYRSDDGKLRRVMVYCRLVAMSGHFYSNRTPKNESFHTGLAGY
jgi:hypothetical protein